MAVPSHGTKTQSSFDRRRLQRLVEPRIEQVAAAQRTQRAMASVAVALCAVKPSLKFSVHRSAVLVPYELADQYCRSGLVAGNVA